MRGFLLIILSQSNIKNTHNLCRLCMSSNADCKGSHIISSFLVNTAFASKKAKRDLEILAKISSNASIEIFYGRNVSPQEIFTLINRDLEDKEINEQINPLIRDYFLCNHCEQRLQRIESIVASKCYKDIQSFILQRPLNSNYFEIKNEYVVLLKVLLLSNIWRASITKLDGFVLDKKLENQLRKFLDSSLDIDEKLLMQKINKTKKYLTNFYVQILAEEHTNDGNDKTNNIIVFSKKHKSPYITVINEWVICIYKSRSSLFKTHVNGFWGLEKCIEKDYFMAPKFNNKIRIIPQKVWTSFKDKIAEEKSKDTLMQLESVFSTFFFVLFTKYPSIEQKQHFIKYIILLTNSSLEKYSINWLIKELKNYFVKFYPITKHSL